MLAFYLAGFKIADHCRLATRALFVVDTDRRVRCARATDDPERLPDVDCARCSNGSERHSS